MRLLPFILAVSIGRLLLPAILLLWLLWLLIGLLWCLLVRLLWRLSVGRLRLPVPTIRRLPVKQWIITLADRKDSKGNDDTEKNREHKQHRGA